MRWVQVFSGHRAVATALLLLFSSACGNSKRDAASGSGASAGSGGGAGTGGSGGSGIAGDSAVLEHVATTFRGIYRIEHHTRNEAGCDTEGPAVDDSAWPQFWLAEGSLGSIPKYIATMCGCGDDANCQSWSDLTAVPGEIIPCVNKRTAVTLVDERTLTLDVLTGGQLAGEACEDAGYEQELFELIEPDRLRITSRGARTDERAMESACPKRPELAELPCETFDVLEGVKVAPLLPPP